MPVFAPVVASAAAPDEAVLASAELASKRRSVLGALTVLLCNDLLYLPEAKKHPPHQTPPEYRLYPAMLGSVGLPLGLFWFVINALMLELASALVPGFHVSGFVAAFVGAIVLSLVNMLLKTLLPTRKHGE